MSTAINTLAGQPGMLRQRLFGTENAADGDFSGVFGLAHGNRRSRRAKIQEAREALSRRFPGLDIISGEAGEGVEGAKKNAEQSDGRDQAIVEASVLTAMFGNSNLITMVEDAISGFMDRGADSNLMNIPGAHVQRTVSISIAVVRYSEIHMSDSTGGAVAGVDLKTNFHNKLREFVQQFFAANGAGPATLEQDWDVMEGAGKAFETGKGRSPWRSMGAGLWSLEFFYSSSFMSGLAEYPAGGGTEAGMTRDNHGRECLAMSGVTAFTGQILPDAILRSGAGLDFSESGRPESFDSGDSSSQASLNDILREYGLEAGSFRSTRDGYFAGIREHRNLLSELMELYEEKKSQFKTAIGMG